MRSKDTGSPGPAIMQAGSTTVASSSSEAAACSNQVGGFLGRVDDRLAVMFDTERIEWLSHHPELADGLDILESAVLGGGKRLRPVFAFHGFVAGGGRNDDEQLINLACAIEMLHAFALIHDDIMDNSALRRHRPSVHEQFRLLHRDRNWAGESRRTAESFAMLVGDLAFAFSTRYEIDLPSPVRRRLDRVRTELHVGQYLDLIAAATNTRDPESARNIARYKTAKYTVEGPLTLGAELAGRNDLIPALAAYGDAVGEAFQHRDDLLGVFGDPAVTGKPRYDDLHAGKGSLLLHLTTVAAEGRTDVPIGRVGDPELTESEADTIAEFMVSCGAVAELESRIEQLLRSASDALESADIPAGSRTELRALAHLAGNRQR